MRKPYNGGMKRDQFIVRGLGGKKTLSGKIAVSGAKNAALKAMAASILFNDPVKLTNVPDIEDAKRMAELLVDLGAKVTHTRHICTIDSSCIKRNKLDYELSKRMRSSVVLTGPLLARFGSVSFPHPGGCVLGPRPIDKFLSSFEKMGASVRISGKHYRIAVRGKKTSRRAHFLYNPKCNCN